MTVQKGLGKGLGALFGELPKETEQNSPVRMLSLQKIEPNPNQPRTRFDPEELEQLARSIEEHGLLQPITVRPLEDGFYQIIAGERRWRAARQAGLSELPALVVKADDKKSAQMALVENLQRQDLNPMEEAEGYRALMEQYGMTQEQTSESVQKSRSAVANALRLLKLPEAIQEMLSAGTITPGHARAVMVLSSEKQQLAAAQKIAALQLSVRQAELMCKSMAKEPKKQKPAMLPVVDYVAECEKNLSGKLGRGVKIHCGKRKGRIELEFYDNEDLEVLMNSLRELPQKEKKS